MKLITYVRMGKVGFGIIKNGGIIELNDRIGNDVTSCLLYTSPSPRDPM